MKNSVTVVNPFIYKIFPEDYISLTQHLVNNKRLFNEISDAKKHNNIKLLKQYSHILKRWKNKENFSSEELYNDFVIYKSFYKEIGAGLKFNPLSQANQSFHILEKILELLRKYIDLIQPKVVYKSFDIIPGKNEITLKDSDVKFTGKKIKIFSGHSSLKEEREVTEYEFFNKKIWVYVTTIGPGIDNEVKSLAEKGDVFDAYLLNGIGAGAAEMVANDLNLFMNDNNFNKDFTYKRISPGYGDWHISEQEKIFKLLNPEKTIGVTLTRTHIMIPEKSTSGIMGLVPSDVK